MQILLDTWEGQIFIGYKLAVAGGFLFSKGQSPSPVGSGIAKEVQAIAVALGDKL